MDKKFLFILLILFTVMSCTKLKPKFYTTQKDGLQVDNDIPRYRYKVLPDLHEQQVHQAIKNALGDNLVQFLLTQEELTYTYTNEEKMNQKTWKLDEFFQEDIVYLSPPMKVKEKQNLYAISIMNISHLKQGAKMGESGYLVSLLLGLRVHGESSSVEQKAKQVIDMLYTVYQGKLRNKKVK